MESENHATAGFGSLLLPTSAKRTDPAVGKAKPIYEDEKGYGDKGLLRYNAVEAWAREEKSLREGDEDAWNIIPVKIDGFERRYSLNVDYSGAMLDVERDEESWMNAVIVAGLSDDEKDALDSSEENYDTKELDLESVEPYLQEHSEELEEAFEEGEVQIYIGDAKTTDRFRNQTYHDRIHTGIDLIGELHGEKYEGDLSEEMWKEFRHTTLENWKLDRHQSREIQENTDEMIWSKVSRNDEIEAAAQIHGYEI